MHDAVAKLAICTPSPYPATASASATTAATPRGRSDEPIRIQTPNSRRVATTAHGIQEIGRAHV